MQIKKQVVIIHYTLPPNVGGVENIIGPIAEIFAKQNYLVTLLAGSGKIEKPNIKTSLIPEFDPNEPHINRMQQILKVGSLPESYEIRLQNLERKIETQIGDIDTIIIHNMMSMHFNLTATEALWNYISRNPHKKFYFWVHDLAWMMKEHKDYLFDRKPWSLLKTPMENVRYITISEYRKRQVAELLRIPRKQIALVPNALKYQDFLRFNPNTTQIITKLSLFHKYPIVLIPSRIIRRKNIERSIEIIFELQKDFPDIHAIITGIPSKNNSDLIQYHESLRKMVDQYQLQNNVIFLDDLFETLNISRDENRFVVHDLYFISHLVLLTSNDEGFGLPILEAGATRTPIAVNQLPVFREIAGNAALFLPQNESPAYNANRIKSFLNDHKSISGALFKRVFDNYNWDMLWEEYLEPLFE